MTSNHDARMPDTRDHVMEMNARPATMYVAMGQSYISNLKIGYIMWSTF